MKDLLSFLIVSTWCFCSMAQSSVTNLRFDLTGGPNDELKEGIVYSWEDLLEIKGVSQLEVAKTDPNLPPFLDCPVQQNFYCVIINIICSDAPFSVEYFLNFKPNGCGGIFDGEGIGNEDELMCQFSPLNVPVNYFATTSCENTDNCITLFGFATGSSFCETESSLEIFMEDVECQQRSDFQQLCLDPVPTLSQWGLIILGLSLSILGFVVIRKRIMRHA